MSEYILARQNRKLIFFSTLVFLYKITPITRKMMELLDSASTFILFDNANFERVQWRTILSHYAIIGIVTTQVLKEFDD